MNTPTIPARTGGMSDRLRDQVVVVAGATGMAAATARRVAEEGGAVFVISLDPGEAEALASDVIGGGGLAGWCTADLRDEDATAAAFDACMDRFGRVDGLFAAAGASARRDGDGPVHEATLAGFRAAFDLNAVPAFTAARRAVQEMLAGGGRGSIVLMSSVLARHPAALFATHGYAASKGAIESLAVTMASHYAPFGIRVNAIAPGLVATPMSERAQADPTTLKYAEAKQPLAGGLLPPGAAAELVVFLLSRESGSITGQVIDVDGGWSVSETSSE